MLVTLALADLQLFPHADHAPTPSPRVSFLLLLPLLPLLLLLLLLFLLNLLLRLLLLLLVPTPPPLPQLSRRRWLRQAS